MAAGFVITSPDGTVIPNSITSTAHAWTADANGLFHTVNLAAEWKADYAVMLAGQANTLSPLQRLEGNAEAVVENTALKADSAVTQQAFREDMQREFDAIWAAMTVDQATDGIDPNREFNQSSYLQMEATLQSNPVLEELGMQGHGLNSPPAVRYRGYTIDFQNNTDKTTNFIGGGADSGENAIAAFTDDVSLSHAPFPTVWHNGVLTQLNQNGNFEDPVTTSITGTNEAAYTRVFVAADFSKTATSGGPVVFVPNPLPAAGTVVVTGIDQTLQPLYVLDTAPAAGATGADPLTWYDTAGWKQGANPNAWFDTSYYLAQNPDVKASGMDPLLHFETYGWKEGRDPSLVFSDSKYLAANPDVKAAGIDPLLHYEDNGQNEGRMTFLSGGTAAADPLINAAYYDKQLGATLIPTGTAADQQAAYSYETTGWTRGLNPDAYFNAAYYLAHNPDVAKAHVDPLLHYEQFGWTEGRNPSATFDTTAYLNANADVKAAGMDPLLHYVAFGMAEGRAIYAAPA